MCKFYYFLALSSILLGLFSCNNKNADQLMISLVNRPFSSNVGGYYENNRAPLTPNSFIKLPIGSIKPGGWLLKSLELSREGMTGKLEEVSPWLIKENNAWLNPKGEGINGWEEVPYWLKGYGDLGYILEDEDMIKEAKSWIDGVINGQREDGYFGAEQNRASGKPDLWPNMVMLWCIQSWYDYNHDERVIPFMRKYFKWEASLPDSALFRDFWGNSRAGDNLYSVYWLYNRTGEGWLIDLAKRIHAHTANWEQENDLPNWHNVNIAQGFKEPGMYFSLSKDSSDLEAIYNNFHLVRDKFGQVPGGMFGADENAREGYSDPHQGIETCGMVEQMNSDEMLLQITGDPFWADHCEDVAFNTYPAALTSDFRALRYFTAPNMVTSDSTNHSPGIQNKGPFFMMNPLSNRCCQHNHTQGWPYYAENLWMATADSGIAAVLYSESSVTAKVGIGETVTINELTHYPFSDTIRFRVQTQKSMKFPLYFRIPQWTEDISLKINGKGKDIDDKSGHYIRVENEWANNDEIVLVLPMSLKLQEWKRNKNSVSVNYGPLTFSLKITEEYQKADPTTSAVHDARWIPGVDTVSWPAFSIYPASTWNYGLLLSQTQDLSQQFSIIKKNWPENNYPFTIDDAPLELVVRGIKIPSWQMDEHGLAGKLPLSPVPYPKEGKTEDITLIPMGAARLRISSFPVVK